MKLALDAVELDTSIQCRASIDTAVVNEYAERMATGDTFPPIDVYGSKTKCWMGDGWHRVLAARQRGAESIEGHLHPGGRVDALKYALGANALHGHRRTNADKRRCVEIALREFPKLSSRAVAKMCGVSPGFVDGIRPSRVPTIGTSPEERTGQDGKQYRARRVIAEPQEPTSEEPAIQREATEEPVTPLRKIGPPRDGLDFARIAIMNLEQIREDDMERDAAFERVLAWVSDHWRKRG